MPSLQQVPSLALQQTLGPQMQQSLHILQVPLLELQTVVRQEMESNPVLEEAPPSPDAASAVPAADPETEALSRLAEEWREYYAQARSAIGTDPDAGARHQFALDSATADPTLPMHLEAQLPELDLGPEGGRLARFLIASLDEAGYLDTPIEELAKPARTTSEALAETLRAVQSLDPPGIAARNLSECLVLQLNAQGLKDSVEARIVSDHLEALARKRYADIARSLKVSQEQVSRAAARIATLDPRPGRRFQPDPDLVVVPDVTIEKVEGGYVVLPNDADLPHLRISDTYKDLMAGDANPEAREYLREKIRGGKFLIRCIHQRQQTILAIAREIAGRQRDFLDHGPGHLKPMTMAQIASIIGVHETTVSRAIASKYIQTPRGVFEMRSFFTSGYQTSAGESVSSTSVMGAIQELIRSENPQHPLSDQEIIATLTERGIPIARRTVAKYRLRLGILASHLRKAG